MTTPYTQQFYDECREGAFRSAQVIIPRTIEVCSPHAIARVIDVGCGIGTWLNVWLEHGVSSIKGLDGDYVNRSALEIPEWAFQATDLNMPPQPDEQWDLAMSLEVGEHLRPESAPGLVHLLTGLAPVVLFSAAIPGQGGVDHVNEQWPHYWAALFADEQYAAIDCLRHSLWEHSGVDWWYQQNVLVFVAKSRLEQYPRLAEEHRRTGGRTPAMVHPEVLDRWKQWGIEQNAGHSR